MNIFLTGATGLLGGEILVNLSKMKEVGKIYCLVRADSQEMATKRIEGIFNLHKDHFDHTKVIAVLGNLTDENLVESLRQNRDLKNIHFVIHSAANTSFSRMHDDLVERVNITGLNHILQWAKQLRYLNKFVYVGTATICGYTKKNCVVFEEENPDVHSKHFVKYTFTKMMGELAVQNELPDEKILIVRPSIIMGDSRPVLPRSPVILWTLALVNMMRLIPVDADSAMDIISVDYAAEAITKLLFAKKNHSVYHISGGTEGSTTVKKITGTIAEFYTDKPAFRFVKKDLFDPMKRWSKKKNPVPASLVEFSNYLDYWNEEFEGNGNLRILLAGLEPYLEFISLSQVFDNTKLLADTGINKPLPAHDYIRNSVNYLDKINVYKAALDP